MSRINVHAVGLHGSLNFREDCSSSGFNAQNLLRLHDVVGPGLRTDDTWNRLN